MSTQELLSQPVAQPFSPEIQRFIDSFINTNGDVEQASADAGLEREVGVRLMKRRIVAAEIARRKGKVEDHVDRIIAQKRVVEISNLDRQLNSVVNIPRKDLKEAPALAASKVKAIELGYRRVGLLVGDDFIPDQGTQVGRQDHSSRIFRATEQQIITHRVETTQTVMTRQVEAAPKKQPLAIDAGEWDKF